MSTLRYIGPIDKVEVVLLRQVVVQGEEFECSEEHAAQLLEQHDNYEPVEPPADDNQPGDPGEQEE